MRQQKNDLHHPSTWKIHGLMIVAVMLIATSFPVGKVIADALPADVMMLIRFMIAALLFAPLVFFKHGVKLPSIKKQIQYALLSVPLITFFWCMFEALKFTSAMNTGAIFTTVPALTALLSFLIFGEKTSLTRSLGLLLGTAGAVLIVFKGDIKTLVALELNHGDLIFFYGAVSFGVYNVFVKRIYTGEPTEVMTFWVIVFGALWLTALSAANQNDIRWQEISIPVVAGLFYLALFTTLITFFLFQFGTVKIGPVKVAAYGFLNPPFVLVFSVLMGMTTLSVAIMPGVVMVIAAMFIIQRSDNN